jgi:hypothetical protein
LNYRDTTINQAGLIDRRDTVNKDDLSRMMCDFWRMLNERYPGSIPPGIIFLPGERLSEPGFRWAPKTWMSAVEIDHPDPLSTFNGITELEKQGLLVQYPGFLLHCQDKKVILGTDHSDTKFTFPIDRDLLEWYSVEPADKERKAYLYQILERPKGKPTELAIILSRSRPREMPPEIGLLVEIYAKPTRWKQGDRKRIVYWCHIIHRVRVWRAKPLYGHGQFAKTDEFESSRENGPRQSHTNTSPSILRAPSANDSQICIGELIDSDQRWFVDSFDPPKPEDPPFEDLTLSGTPGISTQTTSETLIPPKNEGSGFKKAALSILWKLNLNARQPQSDSTSPPLEENSSTTDGQRQKLKSTNTFTVGTSSTLGQKLLSRRWTGR